jgi:hypothetical protein
MDAVTAAQIFDTAANYLGELYATATDEESDKFAYGVVDIDEMYMLVRLLKEHGELCLKAILADLYQSRLLKHATETVIANGHEQFTAFYEALKPLNIDSFPLLRLDRKPTN